MYASGLKPLAACAPAGSSPVVGAAGGASLGGSGAVRPAPAYWFGCARFRSVSESGAGRARGARASTDLVVVRALLVLVLLLLLVLTHLAHLAHLVRRRAGAEPHRRTELLHVGAARRKLPSTAAAAAAVRVERLARLGVLLADDLEQVACELGGAVDLGLVGAAA